MGEGSVGGRMCLALAFETSRPTPGAHNSSNKDNLPNPSKQLINWAVNMQIHEPMGGASSFKSPQLLTLPKQKFGPDHELWDFIGRDIP